MNHNSCFESWLFISLVAFKPDYIVICEAVAVAVASSQTSISVRSECHPIDEFFDRVIDSCSRCSDICWQMQPRKLRRNNHCRLSCPDYYEQQMRHLSSPRLPSSHATWTVTTTTRTSFDHNDVTAEKYGFLTKPLFWVSAVCLFIAVLATAVIAIVCCRYPRTGETHLSSDRHQNTVFIEGKHKPSFSTNITSHLKSTQNTKSVENLPSSGIDSSEHSCAEVACATKQPNTFMDNKTAIVRPNLRMGQSPSASLSSSSSSPSSSQKTVEVIDIQGLKRESHSPLCMVV